VIPDHVERDRSRYFQISFRKASAPKVQTISVPKNRALLFLPPYSPELNPVDHIWADIRENGFVNKVFALTLANKFLTL
jgi:transposase